MHLRPQRRRAGLLRRESSDETLWKGRRFPASACISGWAIQHGQVAVVSDVYDDERIPQQAYAPTFVRSLAMVPMRDGEHPLGATGAYWKTTHSASELELSLLQLLADAGANALSRTQLLEHCKHLREAASLAENGGGSRLVQRMVAIIAHDLRGPLGTITNGIELLERTERLSDRGAHTLRRMRNSCDRGSRLVRHLMDYSEIQQHGGVPIHLQAVRLDALADQLIREASAQHPDRTFEFDAKEVEGLWDPDRLLEALTNLLRNAIEHGDPEGPITVCVGDTDAEGRISIHNRGEPIPADSRAQLFEPFMRRGVPSGSGSIGLGLYITDQVVKAHAGRIVLESSAETGTRFTVVLPKNPIAGE